MLLKSSDKFSNGSWSDIGESMITSNCTFTVRKGPMLPMDDDADLMSVPMVQSVFNIDREALRREEQLQSSIVLGESRIGVEHLPIIEDENELETPLVETRTMTLPNDVNANLSSKTSSYEPPVIETPRVEIPENGNVASSPITSPTSSTEQQQQSPSSMISHESDSRKEEKGDEGDQKSDKHKKMEEKVVSKKKEETPTTPAPPKFPVKPKAPSKHQLMMEQLKASIEAEKNKPKKEVKSRVSLLPPPAPKAQKENKEGGEMTETPRRSISKTPLKTVNAKAKTVSPAPPVERPKKERKPLYVAPPAKERVEKKPPPKSIVSPPTTAEKKPVASSIPSTSSSTKGAFPTSSFAGGVKIQAPRKASTASSVASAKKKVAPIDEKEKLARLHRSIRMFDALTIVMSEQNKETERKLGDVNEQYEKRTMELGELKKMLDEARKNLRKMLSK
uniref:VASt domain-containing protein n=1 Tax=Caenorhabditis tropicalis TaxID=1561998 RepID=A0A1I7TEI6_9PELO